MKKLLFITFLSLLLTGCSIIKNNNKEPDNTPDDPAYLVNEHHILMEEVNIYGNLYAPLDFDALNSYPLVILSHSANINSDSLKSYAIRMSELGYLAYAFDYPGSSFSSRSDSIAQDTIFTEIDTLNYVISYFKNVDYVNENIFLFGTSQGGLISSQVADTRNDDLAGMILFYPAFNIPEYLITFYGNDESNEYVQQLKNYDVYDHIAGFKKDVLIVHGTKDIIVPSSYSEKASKIYENCTLKIVEGANHGFNKENYAFNNNYDEITWNYAKNYLVNHKWIFFLVFFVDFTHIF